MSTTKRAIVVGASSGIGREVAKILIEKGWHVGVAARRVELLASLQELAPERVSVSILDVTSADATSQLNDMVEHLGGMDLYFHASGIGKQNPLLEEDIELATMTTNAVGFTRMIGAAFRYMASHGGGHIAAITSIAGTKGLGPAPSYSATKAMQNTYLQALEQLSHTRHLNIRFTDLRPGFVDTALLGDAPHYPLLLRPERVAREMVRSVELRRHRRVID